MRRGRAAARIHRGAGGFDLLLQESIVFPRFALPLDEFAHQLAQDLRSGPIGGLGLGDELRAHSGSSFIVKTASFGISGLSGRRCSLRVYDVVSIRHPPEDARIFCKRDASKRKRRAVARKAWPAVFSSVSGEGHIVVQCPARCLASHRIARRQQAEAGTLATAIPGSGGAARTSAPMRLAVGSPSRSAACASWRKPPSCKATLSIRGSATRRSAGCAGPSPRPR